jgi:hypothetical protein
VPAGRLPCLRHHEQRLRQQVRPHGHAHPRSAAGCAGSDRGVRRCTGARPRAGDRHVPLRLDPGLRTVALDPRQAGAARNGGDGRSRSVQPSVLLVLPALRRRGLPAPLVFDLRGLRSLPGRWPRSRSAPGRHLVRRVVPAIVATLVPTRAALAAGVPPCAL